MTEMTQTLRARLKNVAAEALLEAAERVMIEKGYEKATMQDIAAAAGCAVGTLYVHFKNKEELFRALVQRHSAGIRQALKAALEPATDPVERMRISVVEHLRWGFKHVDAMNMMCEALPMRYYDFKSRLDELVPEGEKEYRGPALENIRAGQAAGKMRKDMPAEVLMEMVDGFMLTMMDQFSARPGRYTLKEQERLTWGFIAGAIGAKGGKHV